jgi:hypothetical protein
MREVYATIAALPEDCHVRFSKALLCRGTHADRQPLGMRR